MVRNNFQSAASPEHQDYTTLIARHLASDPDAFRLFYNSIKPRLIKFFERRDVSSDDAEDLFQNTMVKIDRFANDYNPERASVVTWAYRIAINELIRFKTKQKSKRALIKSVVISKIETQTEPDFSNEIDRDSMIAAILDIVNTLPEDWRAILKYHLLEDMTFKAISEKLSLNHKTVSTRFYQAKNRLGENRDLKNLYELSMP